jgi:hypothetical protein
LIWGAVILAALVLLVVHLVWVTNRIGRPGIGESPLPNWADIATAIAAGTALIGIYVAWRTAERARHATTLADISRRWDEPLLVESRQLAARYGIALRDWVEYLDQDVEDLAPEEAANLYKLQRIPNFFEDLAILEQAGAITFNMIQKSLGWTIVKTWDRWRPAVDYLRDTKEPDPVYSHFQHLAERMRRGLAAQEPLEARALKSDGGDETDEPSKDGGDSTRGNRG